MNNRINRFIIGGALLWTLVAAVAITTRPVQTQGPIGTYDPNGNFYVRGNKTNNGAAADGLNLGVLPCLATASAPSLTEGRMVGCSTDLAGNLRMLIAGGGSATVTEAATEATGVANLAAVSSYLKAYDGATFSRLRGRTSTPGASDFGLVTRPMMNSDGTNTMPVGDTAARAIFVQQGASTPVLANALSTTVKTVAASAAQLTFYHCSNPNTSAIYVQVFDISGTVTLGTSTPAISLRFPGTDGTANLSQVNLTFANAIKVAATTTATGSSAPSTAVDCNFGYR